MKKTILAIGILILLIIAAFIPISIGYNIKISTTKNNRNIFYVGGGGPGNYSRIQEAIDNTTDGDTVFVYSGTYDEYLDIHKSIKLTGEDKLITIINDSIVSFLVSNIYFSGFTVQYGRGIDIWNTSFSPTYNNHITGNIFKSINPMRGAITIDNSSDNTISDNLFFDNGLQFFNIDLLHNFVFNNSINNKSLVYFEDTSDKIIQNAGQVILLRCKNMKIENQDISNTNFGIQFFNTDNCYIINNAITNNTLGVFLDKSNNNIISKNRFTDTMVCEILLFDESSNITIIDNYDLTGGIGISSVDLNGWNTHKIINNSINNKKIYYYKNSHIGSEIPSDVGQIILANCSNFIIKNLNLSYVYICIQLGFSSNNTISNNTINNNFIGSYLINSHMNNFYCNKLNNNSKGFLLYSSKENYIYNNLFKNNSYAIDSSSYDRNDVTIFLKSYKNKPGIKIFEKEVNKNVSSIDSSNNIISNNTFLGNNNGIWFSKIQNDIISNNIFSNNNDVIEIWSSNNIVISGNNIISSKRGIDIFISSNIRITDNNISYSKYNAIKLLSFSSINNYISGNNISDNNMGLYISGDNNTIIHNNFIDNLENVDNIGNNIWDDGKYGNFWSNYKDRYPDAKPKILKPWMWNTPYEVSTWPENKDNCPLVRQWPKSYSVDIPKDKTSTCFIIYKFLNNHFFETVVNIL